MKSANTIYILCAMLLPGILLSQQGGNTSGAVAYCDTVNSGFISLTGFSGTVVAWQSSADKISWTNIQNNTTLQSYTDLKQSTSFRAITKTLSMPPDTSSISTVTVHPPGFKGSFTGTGVFCALSPQGKIKLIGQSGNVVSWISKTSADAAWSSTTTSATEVERGGLNTSTFFRCVTNAASVCPNDTSSVLLIDIVPASEGGEITGPLKVCPASNEGTLSLSANRGEILNWQYSYDNGNSWNKIENTSSTLLFSGISKKTIYTAEVRNGICPSATAKAATVSLSAFFPASAGDDKTLIQFESVTLQASGEGEVNWSPAAGLSATDILSPSVSPDKTTTYTLTVNNTDGCTSKDVVTIHVIVPIPNTITPNGDGINDQLLIEDLYLYPGNSFTVFNRWGKQVFSASPYLNNWEGRTDDNHVLPDDIYYYLFDTGAEEGKITGYVLIKR